ncbi:MAG TPA: peptide deformylase [Nevskiaceae bacterium]
MALLTILQLPDQRLRGHASAVTAFDAKLRKLVDDMFETMYDAPGVGLAAPQVGIGMRLAVMDCSEQRNERHVMINPELIERADPLEVDEGCLSVPEVQAQVPRFGRVTVRAFGVDGKPFELSAEGLLAQCVQHEMDHLDGKLFIDYLSRLKRERIRKRIRKQQRRA